MEVSKKKPILLLDVDGPLNPYAAKATKRPEGFHTHRMRPKGFEVGKPLRVWLNPTHGSALKSIGYEIIWATAWNNDANTWIGPHVGLPVLEHIPLRMHLENRDSKLFWKTQQIASYMLKNHPGRDFIWVDDEVKDRDLEYLRDFCPVSIEIFQISPKDGLQDKDFEKMREWKEERTQNDYAN